MIEFAISMLGEPNLKLYCVTIQTEAAVRNNKMSQENNACASDGPMT